MAMVCSRCPITLPIQCHSLSFGLIQTDPDALSCLPEQQLHLSERRRGGLENQSLKTREQERARPDDVDELGSPAQRSVELGDR